MSPSFPCSPMNRQCLRKKTRIVKNSESKQKLQNWVLLQCLGKYYFRCLMINISFSEFFLDDENIWFVDYADDTTSYMLVTKQQKYKWGWLTRLKIFVYGLVTIKSKATMTSIISFWELERAITFIEGLLEFLLTVYLCVYICWHNFSGSTFAMVILAM